VANKKLTDEQKKAYMDSGGLSCPYCGSEKIWAAGDPSMDGPEGVQLIKCPACGNCWMDLLGLVGVREYNA
jgi:transposase-like protein